MTREFLLIASAHFFALLSPGQDFLLLVRTALVHGFRRACLASSGIALANALWITVAILAVEQIRAWEHLMHAFRWAGAAVLAWMGWQFLRAGRARGRSASAAAAPGPAHGAGPVRGEFWLGLLSGLCNPKNGLFYAGLFSAGISSSTAMSWKIIYGSWMTLAVLLWDVFVSALIGHESVRRNLARWQGRIEQAAGVLLILLGLAMAVA